MTHVPRFAFTIGGIAALYLRKNFIDSASATQIIELEKVIAACVGQAVLAERERCVKVCDDVTVAMNAECPMAVKGWWPDQVGYACIHAIQGHNAEITAR